MRALACLVVVTLASPARAGGFVDAAGGLAFPLGEKAWTDLVETSPKLGVRVGALQGALGGMLSLDWTPENLDNMGGGFGIGSANIAAHRFRILAHVLFQQPIAPKLTLAARAGAGIDVAHASYSLDVLGAHSEGSDTDTGFAFEIGAGLWFDLGSVQIGPELALPIGGHSKKASRQGDFTFDYTSYDLDLLFCARFRAH